MKLVNFAFLALVSCVTLLGCQIPKSADTGSGKTQDHNEGDSPGESSQVPGGKKAELRLNQRAVPRGLDYSKAVEKFAFGSSANQDRPQPIWKTILAQEPDLFIFMGNNIFANEVSQKQIGDQYTKLDKIPEYREIRTKVPFLAIWNDLDYGLASGGGQNPAKEQARKEFLNYWAYVKDSIALNQGPLYHSKTIGGTTVDKKRRRKISKTVPSIHFILLDTRWNRDALHPFVGPKPAVSAPVPPPSQPPPPASPLQDSTKAPELAASATVEPSAAPAVNPLPENHLAHPKFVPSEDPKGTLLGETQWEWLEDELKQSADLIVLVSPIQVIANEHGFERWGLFPKERERLFQLIRKTQPKNMLILSGDRSFGVVSKLDVKGWGTLTEVTSGTLNQPPSVGVFEKDQTYQGEIFPKENFGFATLDWANRAVKIEIKNLEGNTVSTTEFKLRR
ncbi:MAG: alkaline phosphatase family protein [Bdellovibrionales bacterium]|nr:alkaline phosphatase family protein [Bdellovibrionales bacterium]